MGKPQDTKARKSRLPFGLRIGGVYASSFGFLVIVFGAIWAWKVDSSVGLAVAVAGLGLFSAGLGLISVGLGKESNERMQAMANLEFREKIAVMKNRMSQLHATTEKNKKVKVDQFSIDSIDQDLRAALELTKWVRSGLYDDFKKVLKDFTDIAREVGDDDLRRMLAKLRSEIDVNSEEIGKNASGIEKRLESMEKQLGRSRRISALGVVYSSGLAAMVAGMAISNIQNFKMGIIAFGVGFILSVVAVVLLLKSFPFRHN